MTFPDLSVPAEILAFGPHPDDVEIGAAATLAKEAAAGRRIVIADLTAGEMGTNGDAATRAAEAGRAAEELGVSARYCLGLPDAFLGAEPWHADVVAGVIRALRPALVLAPWGDGDRHPDHRAAYDLVRRAVFLAGLFRHPARFPGDWTVPGGLPPHRPQRVFYYLINSPARPDVLLDVSLHYQAKRRALAAFASQFGARAAGRSAIPAALNDGVCLPGVEGRDASFGRQCGVEYAEGFIGERFPCLGSLLDVISCR